VITDYASLQSEIAGWLNRSDLTGAIQSFIGAAEEAFASDDRLRKLKSAAFSITADDLAVPADFLALQTWVHDGGTYYGPIEIVGADALPGLKARYGTSGPPAYAAILDGKFRFAPAPDNTYATKMTYWRTIGSASAGTSWLFTEAPYLYLYGALVAAAPYLQDDERVAVWEHEVEKRIEAIRKNTWNQHFSGTMLRLARPIGG
jgi:hypothetical protein